MKPGVAAAQSRIWLFITGILFSVVVLSVAGGSPAPPSAATSVPASPSGSPSAAESSTVAPTMPLSLSSSPTPAALSTAEITLRYNNALHATAEAIVETLPTLTPRADLPPVQAEREQKIDLWSQALNTAIALDPPPPEYDPRTLNTPTPPHTPWPTAVIPQRALGGGTLYTGAAPIDPACFTMRRVNSWRGQVAGVKMVLCAGRVYDRTSDAGMLIVETLTGDEDNPVHDDLYHPSPELGAVWIVDIQGTVVILQSTAGQLVALDLATHQWVTPAPSPVPSPPPTP